MSRKKLFKLLASIFATLSTVMKGVFLFPLAWMIPMTIKLWKAFKNDSDISPERAVTTFLFVNEISGGLMFADHIIRERKDRRLPAAAYMVMLYATISNGILLIPLIWMIPFLRTFKTAYLEDKRVSLAVKITSIIFASPVASILMFIAGDKNEKGELKELQPFVKTPGKKELKEYVASNEEVQKVMDTKHSTSHLISKRRHVSLPQWATAWIVLIPALIFIIFFMFYPIINTFLMAFVNGYMYKDGGGSFALGSLFKSVSDAYLVGTYDAYGYPIEANTILSMGFDNFMRLFTGAPGDLFMKSIGNTVILVIVEVPLTIIVSLLIATFLHSIKALKGLFQTIFFLPYVTNSIALGMVFQIMFASGQGGLINMIVSIFGIKPINWLNPWIGGYNKFLAGIVVVVYSLWTGLAFKILVFMSGLATIDKQYSDAAKVDGASSFTIWRRITLPLLSPQILYITITSFIGAFKMYSGVMSVFSSYSGGEKHYFGGKAGDDWMPVVGWIYRAMTRNDYGGYGVAAAGSLVLLVIILIVTAIQGLVSRKRVHY